LADGLDRLADELTGRLDDIEDHLEVGSHREQRQKLGDIRRTTVRVNRQLAGLRAFIDWIARARRDYRHHFELQPENLRSASMGSIMQLLKYEIVRCCCRRGHRLIGEEANRHLNILSMLAALFLPPTLITGIFGMNTKGLPSAGTEQAFLWVLALMVGSTFAVFWILRQIGILR
jgi:zinc transporter